MHERERERKKREKVKVVYADKHIKILVLAP